MFGNSDNFTRRNKTYLGQSEARVTILGFKSLRRDTTLSRDPSRNTLFVKFKMWKVYQVQRGARHFSNEIKHHQVQVSYKWNRKKIVFYTRKDKDFSENKHPDYECRMERSMVFGYIQFSIHKQFLIYKLIFYIINIQMSLKNNNRRDFGKNKFYYLNGGIITHITHFLDENHTILILCYFELTLVNKHCTNWLHWVTEFCKHGKHWQLIQYNLINL